MNLADDSGYILYINWWADEVALRAMTFHRLQGLQLFFAFYTFSNNVGSHRLGHCNDGANDILCGAIRGYVVDKRSINLDALNGELL